MTEALIHPTLLLSISDHYNRIKVSNITTSQICGLILGKFNKINNSISLLNSFDSDYQSIIDNEKLKHHLDLLSEIYGNGYLELIGFYIIDCGNIKFDSNTIISNLQNINQNTDNLVLMTVQDLDNITSIDKLSNYINIKPLIPTETSIINYQLKLLQSENITISTYETSSKTIQSNNSKEISNSLNHISSKLQKAIEFLRKVENGEIDVSKSKEAKDALNSLAYLNFKTNSLKSSTINNDSTNSDDDELELDKILAYSSLCSSLLLENLTNL